METKQKYKEIEIQNITSAADNNTGALWGVSKNGQVYEFDFQKQEWKKLPMITPNPL